MSSESQPSSSSFLLSTHDPQRQDTIFHLEAFSSHHGSTSTRSTILIILLRTTSFVKASRSYAFRCLRRYSFRGPLCVLESFSFSMSRRSRRRCFGSILREKEEIESNEPTLVSISNSLLLCRISKAIGRNSAQGPSVTSGEVNLAISTPRNIF